MLQIFYWHCMHVPLICEDTFITNHYKINIQIQDIWKCMKSCKKAPRAFTTWCSSSMLFWLVSAIISHDFWALLAWWAILIHCIFCLKYLDIWTAYFRLFCGGYEVGYIRNMFSYSCFHGMYCGKNLRKLHLLKMSNLNIPDAIMQHICAELLTTLWNIIAIEESQKSSTYFFITNLSTLNHTC